MEGKHVTLVKEGKIGIIRFNKPKANTYNYEMMQEFNQAVEAVRFDEGIRVAVLTSSVQNFFSAGADIEMLRASDPDYKAMFCLFCQEALSRMESTPKVFISAINGHCVGGGLEIALATDVRFMIDDPKLQIGLPEVTLGVLPGTGGTQRLPRLINKSMALDMMITGRRLSPQEALRVGLVNYLAPAESFESEWRKYAEALANGPVRAIGLIKRSVQEGLEAPISQGLALERELQNRLFVTKDAKEGLSAFAEKRKPVFAGN
ncbi:enoyl-CoA hydratase/isomerase [mine drainage metagenome]|uniref:Enoyl-CoA hydratase/isomerase n=1 Tax=mine drainage metagenome TaxID=410659 RepID=T1CZR0_9ZZZZ